MLAHRAYAAAEVDPPALGTGGEPNDLGRSPAPERDPVATGPLGQRTQGQPAKGGLPSGERIGADRDRAGSRSRGLQGLEHDSIEELDLFDQLGLGLGDVALDRPDLAKRGQRLGPDPVTREPQVEVRFVVGERQLGIGREAAGVGALEPEQRPDHAAAARLQAAERARPGRGRKAIEHRLGEVRPRVAGGDPGSPGPHPQTLGRRVSHFPRRRLKVAVSSERLGTLDVEIDPQPGAEVAADQLVALRRVAKPVVDVQGVDALRVDRLGEARRQAGRIGTPGHHHHA